NPAAKGSVITVFASGLGAVTPTIPDGSVAPNNPPSRVTGTFGATIAGIAATVQFAGLAPGLAGTYAMNIQIPASAPSGTQELLIFVNGKSSQKGATVEIQ